MDVDRSTIHIHNHNHNPIPSTLVYSLNTRICTNGSLQLKLGSRHLPV
jgi:hypothetical protein